MCTAPQLLGCLHELVGGGKKVCASLRTTMATRVVVDSNRRATYASSVSSADARRLCASKEQGARRKRKGSRTRNARVHAVDPRGRIGTTQQHTASSSHQKSHIAHNKHTQQQQQQQQLFPSTTAPLTGRRRRAWDSTAFRFTCTFPFSATMRGVATSRSCGAKPRVRRTRALRMTRKETATP